MAEAEEGWRCRPFRAEELLTLSLFLVVVGFQALGVLRLLFLHSAEPLRGQLQRLAFQLGLTLPLLKSLLHPCREQQPRTATSPEPSTGGTVDGESSFLFSSLSPGFSGPDNGAEETAEGAAPLKDKFGLSFYDAFRLCTLRRPKNEASTAATASAPSVQEERALLSQVLTLLCLDFSSNAVPFLANPSRALLSQLLPQQTQLLQTPPPRRALGRSQTTGCTDSSGREAFCPILRAARAEGAASQKGCLLGRLWREAFSAPSRESHDALQSRCGSWLPPLSWRLFAASVFEDAMETEARTEKRGAAEKGLALRPNSQRADELLAVGLLTGSLYEELCVLRKLCGGAFVQLADEDWQALLLLALRAEASAKAVARLGENDGKDEQPPCQEGNDRFRQREGTLRQEASLDEEALKKRARLLTQVYRHRRRGFRGRLPLLASDDGARGWRLLNVFGVSGGKDALSAAASRRGREGLRGVPLREAAARLAEGAEVSAMQTSEGGGVLVFESTPFQASVKDPVDFVAVRTAGLTHLADSASASCGGIVPRD